MSAENWSADEVAKQALEFTQELQAGIEFTLSVRRNYISWGADAAAFEVLLMISASVISGLATTAIQEKISQLSRRLSGADQPAEPLNLRFNPAGVVDAVDWVGGVEAGWAGQAALVVVVGPFLRGFLIAGWRTAGPERRPLERPGERPEGFGAAAGDPTAHSRRRNPLRTR